MTAAGQPNECTFPAQDFTAADSDLFGQCQFTDVSSRELALSDQVLAAAEARKNKLPVRDAIIQVSLQADAIRYAPTDLFKPATWLAPAYWCMHVC